MKLSFHGAARSVTGSRHLLEMPGNRILLDCGLFQGLKELRLMNWRPPAFEPKRLEAVLLTHAHIDHFGLAAGIRVETGRDIPCFIHAEDLPKVAAPIYRAAGGVVS